MKALLLLEPGDLGFPAPSKGANLIPNDLIEAITGIPNLTHYWNKFGLKREVVERLTRG
jgi:hypothetical protein